MKHSMTAPLTAVFVALATLAAPTVNAKGDEKVTPGTMCQPASATQSKKLIYAGNGRVMNISDKVAYVVCPYVRDLVTENPHHISVVVEDKHPTDTVKCTFTLIRWNGSVNGAISRSTSGLGIRTLKTQWNSYGWWEFDRGGLPAPDRTPYMVTCQLPPQYQNKYSAVLYMKLDEQD